MKQKTQQTAISQMNLEDEILVVEESKGRRIVNALVNALLVVAIALAAMCTYISFVNSSGNGVPSILGIRIFSIQTESMYPALLPGDLIFDVGVKEPEELRVGDVITYWTVINGERVLNTHRIHEVYDGGGFLIFSTKGDNNTIADPLTVHESEVVGKYAFRISGLGKVFDYLQTSTGFLIVIVIPVFLFFLFHLIQFFRVLFEYQNVKNRIKYEMERGSAEDLIAEQQRKQAKSQAQAREKMEAELRERLRAEIMASMEAQKAEPAPEEAKPAIEEAAPVAEEAQTEAAPVMDEAAIEALIAKQREAIEAQLREKILAEMNQKKTEK